MPKGDFRTRRFAEEVRKRALAAGYDVDSPRGGGKTNLASDTGMSLASVSRMLSGQAIPEARFMTPLAAAVHMDVVELFVLAGLIEETAHSGMAPRPRSADLEDVARELGITEPDRVKLFKSVVGSLLSEEAEPGVPTGKARR